MGSCMSNQDNKVDAFEGFTNNRHKSYAPYNPEYTNTKPSSNYGIARALNNTMMLNVAH